MKTYFLKIARPLLLICLVFSCTDLSETVYSEIDANNFFNSEKDLIAYTGRAYTKLQSYPGEQFLWALGENASDELVIPAKDNGDWYDQGRWEVIQKHTLSSSTSNNKILTKSWNLVFEGISACNEILSVITPIEFNNKERVVGEIKILRAYYYYWAIDYWGNVPYSVDFAETELPQQQNRKFIFDFIVNEINDNVGALQDLPTPEYYGRVTQGMAYTLLAKMYLNSKEWTGEDKFSEAVAACDMVIGTGAYSIENNYFSNFLVKNENSSENIFVIPFHPSLTGDGFYWGYLSLNPSSKASFDMIADPWDGFVVQPDFFAKYAENDLRRNSFLFGQQYNSGGNPIVEGGEPFIYTPTIEDYTSRKKWEGARIAKYQYQKNINYGADMENDFALFRYADVLYMKLEALYRLGRAGEFIDNSDLQKIRTRAGLAPYTVGDLSDSELLDEFGREFAWEGRRRQDLIRFGVYGNAWWEKPASGPNKKLFPIPQTALNTNPNLAQNPD
ncbi:RagB/SusD family nutrient uptake outer membrane protein [Gelidibacter salicanalis]|uniref:RagB/SusD family nutrient uptake outer membrane protein n=1 Tax=Gelidibacter salicanalis TaxID=291193 RepID=A0A934NJ33_9FLAO|nr:RagB/SusD family nutrient uptake outer membrane protein [Gelidibacter salicanalis]MBJ7881953.1 RagB/SusD family nutrient uptake outer membrane protein [Gelidibacter salicanalis]